MCKIRAPDIIIRSRILEKNRFSIPHLIFEKDIAMVKNLLKQAKYRKKPCFILIIAFMSISISFIAINNSALAIDKENAGKIKSLEYKIEAKPEDPSNYGYLYNIYDKLKLYDEAIKTTDRGIKAINKHKENLSKGSYTTRNSSRDMLIYDYNFYLADLYFRKGTAYMKKGDYTKAIELMKYAIEDSGDTSEFSGNEYRYITLGDAYAAKGDKAKAIEAYNKSISILLESIAASPSKISEKQHNIAEIYANKLHDKHNAVYYYLSSTFKPDNSGYKNPNRYLASLFYDIGMDLNAIHYYNKFMPEPLYGAGKPYQRLGLQTEELYISCMLERQSSYKTAKGQEQIKQCDDFAQNVRPLCESSKATPEQTLQCDKQDGNFGGVIAYYKNALAQTPQAADNYIKIALYSYMQNGNDYSDSILTLEEADKKIPANAEMQYYIGYIYYNGFNCAKAAEYFKKALVLAPGDQKYAEALQQAEKGASSLLSKWDGPRFK